MNDLDWNDYFDNDRESGGSYESTDEKKAREARVKAYNDMLKQESSTQNTKGQ